LTQAAWVNPTPLAAAVNASSSGQPPTVSLPTDDQPGADRLALTTPPGQLDWPRESLLSLLSLTDQMTAFASLVPEPEAYLERSLPPLLAPLSNAVAPPRRQHVFALALTEAATAVPPVSVVAGSEVNLISEDGRVPVVVKNDSNEPVSGLVVNLIAETAAIQIGDPVALDLRPGQSATARVPVHAVANGVFQVRVDLLDPTGRPVADGSALTMRVQAEWEDVGTVVIAGVLTLILTFGVFSTVRKRRAQAAGPDQDELDQLGEATPRDAPK
ncbi:MAG: DUF6049 family protein, partial [Bifidobacteriaceae bacterium]|jgi:hypothetical protein|nr:DUF6049 family protein [Bifidobacteriaceae bacterium]